MAAPNIVQVTTILGETKGQALTTTLADMVENTASSGLVYKINHMIVANIDGVNSVDITIAFVDASAAVTYYIAKNITLPPKASIDIFARPFYLEEGDKIRIQSSADGDAEATISWENISAS